MRTEALLILSRWLSPSFPTGGFAWSHGLEAEVAARRITSAEQVRAWLAGVLAHGSGRNDAILLAASWNASTDEERAELAALALALAAGTERATETSAQGAAFAQALKDGDGLVLPDWPLPVVVGAASRAMGAPLHETLLLYLQNFATNLIQVAIRHLPLGQGEGQAMLASLSPLIRELAGEAMHAGLEDLGGCALAADMASIEHETMQPRIFRS